MNFINKIDKVLSKLSFNFVRILLGVIVIGMFLGNSVYLYIDTPDFRNNNVWNYLGIILNIIGFCLIILLNRFLNKKFKTKKYINLFFMALYFVGEIIYLKLVPIKPFSDMLFIVNLAHSNFKEEIDYLYMHPNNLPTMLIFNLIFRITKYETFYLKFFNVICNLLTIYFTYKLYKNIYKKENEIVFLLGVFFIPAFLYVNNIYNDLIFTALTTIALYLVTKQNINRLEKLLIPIILFLQYIVRPVGIIIIVAVIMYYMLKKKNMKMIISIISIFAVLYFAYSTVEKIIIPKSESDKELPIWSYIQMGINETEIGFQDGSFSTEWTFNDVKDRIIELGPVRLTKLLVKKEYWLWTEGTYQTQRYAFGTGEDNQFYYDTPITNHLYDVENSNLRKSIEYILKGQYFVIILFALIEIFIKDEDDDIANNKDLLLYTIIGIFCFYLVWEIKSRYIYCLYPIFLIFATNGIDKTLKFIKLGKDEKNGKV